MYIYIYIYIFVLQDCPNKTTSAVERFELQSFQKKMEGKTNSGDFGRGDRPGKGPRMDKKEVQVWKCWEKVEKADFRHCLDAIDVQLEAVHQFKYPGLILKKIRMCEDVTDYNMLNEIRE